MAVPGESLNSGLCNPDGGSSSIG